jgi:hypothetical protein
MRRRPAVYGLDIETDTTENGLDPRVAAVVTVALAGPGYEEVFTGPEAQTARNNARRSSPSCTRTRYRR